MISISKSNALLVALIVFTILSSVIGRALLVPLLYIPIYVTVILLFISAGRVVYSKFFISFFLLVLFIQLTSVQNIIDINSSAIYLLMWLMNVFVAYVVVYYDRSNFIIKAISNYGIFLIISMILMLLIGISPSDFYGGIGININLVAFIVVISFYYSYLHNGKNMYIPLSLTFLLTGSRMQILMVATFYCSKLLKYKAFKIILLVSILIGLYPVFDMLKDQPIIMDFYSLFIQNSFSFSEKMNDKRRIYLLVSAIEVIRNMFPFGTGLGLENFKFYAHHYLSLVYSGDARLSMTHNFYLSYLSMLGVMFFPLLAKLVYPLFFKSHYRLLLLIFLVGIAFNEYITSPFFWVVYGMSIKLALLKEYSHV
jgi:hypothetical protein